MKRFWFGLLVLSLVLSACQSEPSRVNAMAAAVTATPLPTIPGPPTSTPTPLPTATVTPVPAPVGERSYFDRPDDTPGLYQVHVLYVTLKDRRDRRRDLDNSIVQSVKLFNNWLAGQTGGSTLRFDTYSAALDITYIPLNRTEAEFDAETRQKYPSSAYHRDYLEDVLRLAGYLQPGKLYLVYFDLIHHHACGDAAWPPLLKGQVVVVYPNATPPGWYPCAAHQLGVHLYTPGYLDLVALHEILHGLGFVPQCGLHQHKVGHSSDDRHDLMYQSEQNNDNLPPDQLRLDPGNDDYYHHSIADCPDLADSAFLVPLPASPEPPPGWPPEWLLDN